MNKNPLPIVLDSNHDSMSGLVGKMEFATEANPMAKLAHDILLNNPGRASFHVDYIQHPDGTMELMGISMVLNNNPAGKDSGQ